MSDVGVPKNWDEFVCYMQTEQGMLTQFGQDYWRSRWPDCTVSMSWVANASEPNTMCWSYFDYYGIPKRSFYFKKRSFETLHVGAIFDDCYTRPGTTFEARPFVFNETGNAIAGATLDIRLYSINLDILAHELRTVDVCADGVSRFEAFRYAIPENAGEQVYFLVVDLIGDGNALLSRSFYAPRSGEPCEDTPYLANGPWISDVKYTKTELSATFADGEITVTVTGDKPAYQVALEVPGMEEFMTYEDNFFWMEPGEIRNVKIKMTAPVDEILVSACNADAVTLKL